MHLYVLYNYCFFIYNDHSYYYFNSFEEKYYVFFLLLVLITSSSPYTTIIVHSRILVVFALVCMHFSLKNNIIYNIIEGI